MKPHQCIICESGTISRWQKWRLFFHLPVHCSECRSAYQAGFQYAEQKLPLVLRLIFELMDFLSPFLLFAALIFFSFSLNYGWVHWLVAGIAVVIALHWIFYPIRYIEDDFKNRIIRKKFKAK